MLFDENPISVKIKEKKIIALDLKKQMFDMDHKIISNHKNKVNKEINNEINTNELNTISGVPIFDDFINKDDDIN